MKEKKDLLLVIDMQNDFVTGSLGNKDAQMIVPNVKAKIKEYADRGDRIIFTRDTHGENYLDTPEGKKPQMVRTAYGAVEWIEEQKNWIAEDMEKNNGWKRLF